MPTLTATTTQTTEVVLAPRLKRKLLTELRAFQEVKTQISALQNALDAHKVSIEKLRVESGENSLGIEGFKISLVSPVRSSLDKKRLLEAGVSMAQLEQGTVTKPTKPYTKVTVPGEVERVYE